MTLIRLTKEFHFEMAHALLDYDGPCKNIHGHSYQLAVTVIGSPLKNSRSAVDGMVVDFSLLKSLIKENIVKQFDHALVLNDNAAKKIKVQKIPGFGKLMYVPYQPTCENLLIDIVLRIKKILPKQVKVHSVRLSETITSYAEWHADDND